MRNNFINYVTLDVSDFVPGLQFRHAESSIKYKSVPMCSNNFFPPHSVFTKNRMT